MRKKKRANAMLDTLFIVIILTVLAVIWIIGVYVLRDINTDLQADSDLTANAKSNLQHVTDVSYKVLDGSIFFMLIMFWIIALITSFLLDTHPIFFIVSLILLIAVFFVVIVMGNFFHEIFTDDITGMDTYFPLTFWIFNHFLIVSIIIGLSILGVMVAKPQ